MSMRSEHAIFIKCCANGTFISYTYRWKCKALMKTVLRIIVKNCRINFVGSVNLLTNNCVPTSRKDEENPR